jgi:signal transduction histidine kinase
MQQSVLDRLETPSNWFGHLAILAQARSSAALHTACAAAVAAIVPESASSLHWFDLAAELPVPQYQEIDSGLMEQLACGEFIEDRNRQRAYLPLLNDNHLRGWICFKLCRLSNQQYQALVALAAILVPVAELVTHNNQRQEQQRRRQFRQQFGRLRDRLLLNDLLPHIADLTADLIGGSQALIALLDDTDDRLKPAFPDAGPDGGRHPAELALLEQVRNRGQWLISTNFSETCAEQRISLPEGVPLPGAWIGIPLIAHEQVIGTLAVTAESAAGHFTDDNLQLLRELSNHAAAALRNGRLFSRVERQARQLRLLNQINRSITSTLDAEEVPRLIMQQVQELLFVEEGSLLLLDRACGDLIFAYASGPTGLTLIGTRLPPGAGIAGAVAASGEAEIVNNTRHDPRFYARTDADTGFSTRNLLAVPLRSVSGVIGVIEVINRRDNSQFSQADLNLLEAVADQAVIALENARRFAQVDTALTHRLRELDRSNTRLHELLRVGNALRAELQMDELLRLITEAARTATGFRNAVIALLRRDQQGVPYMQRVTTIETTRSHHAQAWQNRVPMADFERLLRPEFRRGESTYVINWEPEVYRALWQESGTEAESMPAAPDATPPASYMLFSLMRDSRNDVLGLISVDDPEEALPPGREQLQVLEIFANQAAVAIENARLYSEQQRNLQSMMALNGLGLAINSSLRSPHQILELTSSGMAEVSAARAVVAYQADETDPARLSKTYQYGRIAPPEETCGQELALSAIRAGRPFRRNADGSRTACLALPLRATRRVMGAICINYDTQLPSQADQETLALFATQAAMAIESLNLFHTLRQGRDQLASIMASTQDGMILISAAGQIVVTNSAARYLTMLDSIPLPTSTAGGFSIALADFLAAWRRVAHYPADEWHQLNQALELVVAGVQPYSYGEFNAESGEGSSLAWSLLPVSETPATFSDEDAPEARRAMLLVLRDTTAAKENERLRQDLTDMIVHDLRNPLSSLSTSIEMMMQGVGGSVNQVQREILTVAMRGIQEMLNMIALLLDISRLEGGGMPINREPHLVERVIRQSIELQSPLANDKQVRLHIDLPADLPRIYVDQELIKRVLQNLLDNALKASQAGQNITVRIAAPAADSPTDVEIIGESEECFFRFYPQRYVTISVMDEGEGIAPQDLEKIFTKFGQSGNRYQRGTGLGLTFCKLVVETHGGRIWVESTYGQGSTFSLTLPTIDIVATD